MKSTSYPKKVVSTSYAYKKRSMQVPAVCVPKLAEVGVIAHQRTSVKKKSMAEALGLVWIQKTISFPGYPRGCHDVTHRIVNQIKEELSGFKFGLAHLFLQHTTASLTINELNNVEVCNRTETFLNQIVPEGSSASSRRTPKGPDDMPAHIKSSLFGCELMIPITNRRLNMGEQQGIWLCEHLGGPGTVPRTLSVVVTLIGMRG